MQMQKANMKFQCEENRLVVIEATLLDVQGASEYNKELLTQRGL
jgi:hypothetical protein